MKANNYDALKMVTDALREADDNFYESIKDELLTPEQNRLLKNLVNKLDNLYAEAYALIDGEEYSRNERPRRCSVAG